MCEGGHGSLGHQPPASRLTDTPGNDIEVPLTVADDRARASGGRFVPVFVAANSGNLVNRTDALSRWFRPSSAGAGGSTRTARAGPSARRLARIVKRAGQIRGRVRIRWSRGSASLARAGQRSRPRGECARVTISGDESLVGCGCELQASGSMAT
jgi:hypothetical protein